MFHIVFLCNTTDGLEQEHIGKQLKSMNAAAEYKAGGLSVVADECEIY